MRSSKPVGVWEGAALWARPAFTMAELIVVAGIAVLVLTMLTDIYLTGRKQSSKLETQLSAIQGAQLLTERIRQDIACSIYAPEDPRPVVESVRNGKLNRLNLLVYGKYLFLERPSALYDPASNTPSWIETQRVSYTFDPVNHMVTRGTPQGEERLGFARFLRVAFLFLEGAAGADGIASESSITIEMKCAPDEYFSNPSRPPAGVLYVPVTLPLLSRSLYQATDLWTNTWFHLSPKVAEAKDGI